MCRDLAPDFDMITGDVLMGQGVKDEETLTPEQYIVQSVQAPAIKSNVVTLKQIPQKQIQFNAIKSQEKMKPSAVTVATAVPTTMVDKSKFKILKKIAVGPAATSTPVSQNITFKRNEPATALKDTSGTIVINKANGSFSGRHHFKCYLLCLDVYMCSAVCATTYLPCEIRSYLFLVFFFLFIAIIQVYEKSST